MPVFVPGARSPGRGGCGGPQAQLALQQSCPRVLSALTYRDLFYGRRVVGHCGPPARRATAAPSPALPDSAARAAAAPARSTAQAPVPGGGLGVGGGTARRRPGPAAGSRQIRVSWRGLTCEPARAAGPRRGAAPARPAALPLPPPPSPPRRRPENGERGRRGGAGEGAGWRRPRARADIPDRPSGPGEWRPSPGGGCGVTSSLLKCRDVPAAGRFAGCRGR